MSDLRSWTWLPFFLMNGAAFMTAIQLPPDRRRLMYAPIIYGTGALSAHMSSYSHLFLGKILRHEHFASLYQLTHILLDIFPEIRGITVCYGLCHMTIVLYISPVRAPSWILAYKLWLDPRRQTDLAKPLRRCTFSDRTFFVMRQILKAILGWAFGLYIMFLVIKAGPTAEDFATPRQVFLRRIPITLYDIQIRYFGKAFVFISEDSHHHIPITLRDIQFRCASVFGWNLVTYLIYNTCHILSSILFVGILCLDTPQEFPPLFGSPLEAYSIRRYWGRFSHRITVPFSAVSGKAITKQWNLPPRTEKVLIILWTFFLSAVCHTVAEWSVGEYSRAKTYSHFYFYFANFCAGAIEAFGLPLLERVWKTGRFREILWSSAGRRIAGYIWVFCFLFWVSPKGQYPDIFEAFSNA